MLIQENVNHYESSFDSPRETAESGYLGCAAGTHPLPPGAGSFLAFGLSVSSGKWEDKVRISGPIHRSSQHSSEKNYRNRSQSGGRDQPSPDSPFPPLSSPHFQGHGMLSSTSFIRKTSRSAPAICQLLTQNQGTKWTTYDLRTWGALGLIK